MATDAKSARWHRPATPGKAIVGERPEPFGEAFGLDRITSTLIFGEHDAVLVIAMMMVAESEAIAEWVALHNRNLETIYLTQAHFDHFDGLSILLDRFTGAPPIGLIVAGDVVYKQCHMCVGDTIPESRQNRIAYLDRLASIRTALVVAGHKKPGTPDSAVAIQETKRYLEDFDRLKKTMASDQEPLDQMTTLYPGWVANQS